MTWNETHDLHFLVGISPLWTRDSVEREGEGLNSSLSASNPCEEGPSSGQRADVIFWTRIGVPNSQTEPQLGKRGDKVVTRDEF
jgi:hypothetical protein